MPNIELGLNLPWIVSGALILVAATAVATWRIARRDLQVTSEIAAIKVDIQTVKDGQANHEDTCKTRQAKIDRKFDAMSADIAEIKTDMRWVKKHLNGGDS